MTPPANSTRCRWSKTLATLFALLLPFVLASFPAAARAQVQAPEDPSVEVQPDLPGDNAQPTDLSELEATEAIDPSETYPTELEVPVDGIALDQLVNTWGNPRPGHRHHEGIDIFAPRNTPVRAVTDGIVYTKGYRRVGGRIVMILDTLGYLHLYAHLESYGPQRMRDRVYRGDILGYVGNSGNAASSSCHLHYGIADPERRWLNPYWVLTRREDGGELREATADSSAPAASESADHPQNPGAD